MLQIRGQRQRIPLLKYYCKPVGLSVELCEERQQKRDGRTHEAAAIALPRGVYPANIDAKVLLKVLENVHRERNIVYALLLITRSSEPPSG